MVAAKSGISEFPPPEPGIFSKGGAGLRRLNFVVPAIADPNNKVIISYQINYLLTLLLAARSNMKVQLLESVNDLEAIAKVIIQLRSEYTVDTLITQIKKQQKAGYQLAYVKSDKDILGVAGFVVGEKLAWGKHIYIDDLVTNEQCRSTGVGSFLIAWFKLYCKELGCTQLHLDSGIQKFPAHRFYLRNRFNIASHHFSITNVCS